MAELLLKQEVYRIVGCAMQVYNTLKAGFLEAVYQEALEVEFADQEVHAIAQASVRILYKGRELKKRYIADFLCFAEVIVEIKATAEISNVDRAQLINYLRATGNRVGVILAFGNKDDLKWERLVV